MIYVVLLLVQENSVLLMRRVNATFGDGLYSMIGGKVEAGEPARSALVREVAEEVGISVNSDDFKLIHTIHRKGVESPLMLLVFKADTWKRELVINEPDKCDDLRWFDLDALPKNLIPAHRQAIENFVQGVPYSEHGW